MNQREAVYNAVVAVIGRTPNKGEEVELTKEQRSVVQAQLITQFLEGKIQFGGDDKSEAFFKKYVPSLINNWLRKDTRLNGGEKYQPKNPGSRTGSGDETMKAMKDLLSITKEPEQRKTIELEIEKRKLELKPRKSINVDALPEHLRQMVPQTH